MTKAELIEAVATKAGVTKADAERTLAAFFDQVVAVTHVMTRSHGRASARSARASVRLALAAIPRPVLR